MISCEERPTTLDVDGDALSGAQSAESTVIQGEFTAPRDVSSSLDATPVVGAGSPDAFAAMLGASAGFDGYRLVRRIGGGAMGEVFEAQDLLLERAVAIKLIHAWSVDEEARERFKVEVRAVARMQHPNVVSIYRVGEAGGRPYLVSELVRGTPLDELPAPVAPALALRIASDIAHGLAAAHQRGVVHRDLKPANAMLSDDGAVKLLDFGIAKLVARPVEPARTAGGRATDGGPSAPAPANAALARDPGDEPRHAARADREGGRAAELTRHGAALGTPRYMAPEVWRGEPASFRADVYSFGALLFRLCTGRPVHLAPDLDTLRELATTTNAPPLASLAPRIDTRLAAIVDECLRRDPTERPANAGELRARIADLMPGARDKVATRGNPYRGLRAFEPEHKDLFFGRDSEIRMILDRLRSEPFVLAAGDSGVGKSSLCRAGVLPRLERQTEGGRRWHTLAVVPGAHPVTALASALGPVIGMAEAELGQMIDEDPAGVARAVRAWQGGERGLVLFLDQLEELVTQSHPTETAAVSELLGWLTVPSHGTRLLGSVRSDFLSRLATLPGIGERVAGALYFVRPLSAERLREIIVAPASAQDVRIEPPELVDELVAGALRAEGGLPLLQFALAELWDARAEGARQITRETLDAVGGVTGALGRHGDAVLEALPSSMRESARLLLLRLVTAERTRARRTAAELAQSWPKGASAPAPAHRDAALDALVRGRLVVARQSAEGPSFEIAHEALVHGWSTLSDWIDAGGEARRCRDRLERSAAEWQRHGRPRELLWRKAQLAEIGRTKLEVVAPLELGFVSASRRQLRRSLARAVTLTALLPLVFVLGYGLWALHGSWERESRVTHRHLAAAAMQSAAAAGRARADAGRTRALALFDAGDLAEAEALWQAHGRALDLVADHQGRSAQALETALLLDATRPESRAAFGDLLLDRAQFAEHRGDDDASAELARRLSLYDDDGTRRADWARAAEVRFAVDPPDARVRVERFELDERGRYRAIALGEWRQERGPHVVARGSYRAVVDAPGRATLQLPFVVARGETLEFAMALPPRGSVPDGYVFVAAGVGSFGSAAPSEQRRDFLHHVPLHGVAVDDFLIARHETTFGEFIAYLEALDAKERTAQAPRVGSGGFQGGLALTRSANGRWELTFQPAGISLHATEGELIRYPGRPVGATQDWRKLPVTGVTAAGAERYAAWLATTGRLPRARICTEHEWERAARGADGREFPHGERLLPGDANHDETYSKSPSAMGPDEVGSYPASASPFGVLDMAGNVWEWTRSSLEPGKHTARGGSYAFGANSSRSTDRELTEPDFRDASVGFRVCASWPPDEAAGG